MRFILVKQEIAGAMLAATWGDITGAPGVCMSTRGPGAANMVNGVTHAWMDRSPLIAITDQYSQPELRDWPAPAARSACALRPSHQVEHDDRRADRSPQLRRAMRMATAPPPGPVQFDLPPNETMQEAADLPADVPLLPNLLSAASPIAAALRPALDASARARKPIILAGLGVLWDRRPLSSSRFAEQLGAPVLDHDQSKGMIPEDHPLRAGCMIGGLIEREIVIQADLIITIGLDGVELQPKPWPYSVAGAGPQQAVRAPTRWCRRKSKWSAISSRCAGEPGRVRTGRSGLGRSGARRASASKSSMRWRRRVDRPVAATRVEIARDVLPRDTIATCDAGASRLLVVQKWQSYGPREFLTSNGLGTMGYAIPGGMAPRLAHPDRPVVAFTGDGGFLMAIAELHTAVRENLPIIVVVFDDQEIGLIRVKQEIKGLAPYGVGLGGIDWEKIAQGFGADGVARRYRERPSATRSQPLSNPAAPR